MRGEPFSVKRITCRTTLSWTKKYVTLQNRSPEKPLTERRRVHAKNDGEFLVKESGA
jgi:hypothetical protein